MDDGYSMKKNFSILLNNISINKFRICFKYKVHSFNEFHMSGFSGELTNNFFLDTISSKTFIAQKHNRMVDAYNIGRANIFTRRRN